MRKKLKWLIIGFSTIIILILVGIYTFIQSIAGFWTSQGKINKELTHESMLTYFPIDNEAQFPHSIDLIMQGEIDGSGLLSFGWADTFYYRSDTIIDDFKIEYNSDWYSDTCFVKFVPIEMTKGNLTINYKIFSSKK